MLSMKEKVKQIEEKQAPILLVIHRNKIDLFII